MKRLFFVPLALSATSVFAQSSVILFGVVDTNLTAYSNKSTDRNGVTYSRPFYLNRGSVTASQNVLSGSGLNANRFGFRGTEDLGGGLSASFWLEAGFTSDDGASVTSFQRRSTVSLSGQFGEIRLGRDYVASYWNDGIFDPFGTNGVGGSLVYRALIAQHAVGTPVQTNNGIRASNMIGYFLPPKLGGVYGQVQYAFNEKNHLNPVGGAPTEADTRSGRYVGARLGYAAGPLDIAVAAAQSTTNSNFNAGTTQNLNTYNLGASYDLTFLKGFVEISKSDSDVRYTGVRTDTMSDVSVKSYLLGITVPVGAGLINASYAQARYQQKFLTSATTPSASQLALGYVYNFSKRTAVYTSVAKLRNRDGAALAVGGPAFALAAFSPKTSVGYQAGIRVAF